MGVVSVERGMGRVVEEGGGGEWGERDGEGGGGRWGW